ncbi:MAG: Fic/DOC family protein [Propylenella sp.]
MYEAADDPYCYPGTSVLKNRLGLRSQAELDEFESSMTAQRADEPLPPGRFGPAHYRAIHRHLFQDVYDWAGNIRTVRIGKGDSMFCYPENIDAEMRRLFEELAAHNRFRKLNVEAFANNAAHFMAELNAIHPFRDGNGRTQNAFLIALANQSGHPLDFERLDPPAMLRAMVSSFNGDEQPLGEVILGLMRG